MPVKTLNIYEKWPFLAKLQGVRNKRENTPNNFSHLLNPFTALNCIHVWFSPWKMELKSFFCLQHWSEVKRGFATIFSQKFEKSHFENRQVISRRSHLEHVPDNHVMVLHHEILYSISLFSIQIIDLNFYSKGGLVYREYTKVFI